MKSLSKTMVIAGGLALSGMIVATLAVAGNVGHSHNRAHMFNATSLDADGDGVLTQDELLAHNRFRFDRLDSNGDGAISPDEYGARLVTMFTRMDTDKDGVLTGDELPGRMARHDHHGKYHHGRGNGHGYGTKTIQQPDSAS